MFVSANATLKTNKMNNVRQKINVKLRFVLPQVSEEKWKKR